MNPEDYEEKMEAAGQMASQAGIAGTVYLDLDPAGGFLRVKVVASPPGFASQLIEGYAQVLEQGAQAMRLAVKRRTRRPGGEEQ